MHGSRFLKALLGDDCAGALVEAVRRTPGLEAVLAPRAMVAWLAALGSRYSGSIPGVEGTLAFERVGGLYKGEVVLGDQALSYDQIPGLELAALLAVTMGEEEVAPSAVRTKDIVRLGKSLDAMVAHVLSSQQRAAAREMVARHDIDPLLKGIFAQAGFRGEDGSVVGSGMFHDIDAIPHGFKIKDHGFISHDGQFYNREEASAYAKQQAAGPGAKPTAGELHSTDHVGPKAVISGAGQALINRMRSRHSHPAGFGKREMGKVEPKGTTAKPAGPEEAAGQTGAQGPQGPRRQARQTASASHVPGITSPISGKSKTLKMEKHQASKPCRDCGHVRFSDGRFVGCPCFSELAKNVTTLLVGAHYLLKFAPEADMEAYAALAMSVSGDR